MTEWFLSLGPVEWFREQFADCPEGADSCEPLTASDLFGLVLVSWAALAVILIVLDRLRAAVDGRSRPLAQVPPQRARTWRWGRKTPPTDYSLLPAGTVVSRPQPPRIVVTPTTRPLALPSGQVPQDTPPQRIGPDPSIELDDEDFWRLFTGDDASLFGSENESRLRDGLAPERYNPISGRVEPLLRDQVEAALIWPWPTADKIVVVVPDEPVVGEEEE